MRIKQTGPESRRCTVLPLTSTDVAGEVVMSSMSCVLLFSGSLVPHLPRLLPCLHLCPAPATSVCARRLQFENTAKVHDDDDDDDYDDIDV